MVIDQLDNTKLYRVKIRYGLSYSSYRYLAYPNRDYHNFGFYGGVPKKRAIILSVDAIQRDMLQVYLAYHDYQFEVVDDEEKYSEMLVYLSKDDFGDSCLLENKQKSCNGYCVASSENDWLFGKYTDASFYKIRIDDQWLGYDLQLTDNKDVALVFSDYALQSVRLHDFFKYKNYKYELVSVKVPCSFSSIFYSKKDFLIYSDYVMRYKKI